jgi:hypothetical protein
MNDSEGGAGTNVRDLVGVIQDDISHVHVRITAAVGSAAVFVTQIPLHALRGQPDWARGLTAAGVLLLMLAAASYFQYTQQLNKLRLMLVAEGLEGQASGTAEAWRTWAEQTQTKQVRWSGNRDIWWFRVGQFLLLAGSVSVAIVLVRLIVA